ncbi:MAG: carboxypeptidase regulatory-like domain-containing protein [Ruminococcus sp.]|nr:carboxypeptidase regulatory-like domain-containing protein [Ruminococcus sp.]
MDKNQLERYKREMMNLYDKRITPDNTVPSDENVAENNVTAPDEEIFTETEPTVPNYSVGTAWAPHSENDSSVSADNEDEFNTRYPEPDLSDLDTDFGTQSSDNIYPPDYANEESLGDSRGYILVNVRTGYESSAVEGATVMVTAIVDGTRLVLASGLTDQSGTTPKFSVPVPDLSHSQQPSPDKRPYNLFDISVTAEGFFNARSVDVPVFSGITSVQNFSMIPVPLLMNGFDETVTIYNQEPDYRSSNAEEV